LDFIHWLPCQSTELKSSWQYAVSWTHFLRNVVIISYPVHNKLFELYHHTSQVDYLCFLGMFIPNWPMPLTVPLGKVIFFSLLHKHRQDCIRSVDVSMSMTSFPYLEVRCWGHHVARLVSATHINLQVSHFTDHSILIRVNLKLHRLTDTNEATCANSTWRNL